MMPTRGVRAGRHAAGVLQLTLALGAGAAWAAAPQPAGHPPVAPQPTGHPPVVAAPAPARAASHAPTPKPLDINSATAAQLATLPGIGPDEARRIVAGRPYLSKAELATRKVLPEGSFIQIKGRIVAIQTAGGPRPVAALRKASGP